MLAGQGLKNFVPNNDLDAVGGDLRRVGEIRAPKFTRPILFDAETPLGYLWTFGEAPDALAHAQRVCTLAEGLYQLGRGVDMAWAWGEILSRDKADARISADGRAVYRPSHGGSRGTLAVPLEGSLESLVERHRQMRARFQTQYELKPTTKQPDRKVAVGQIFVQPRNPAFDRPPTTARLCTCCMILSARGHRGGSTASPS